ncbi:hypothetical protein Tco_1505346 [Tanacetum coccineum]
MNEITDLHQILEEVLLTECGDDVGGLKQHRRDPSSDGVRDLVMASGRLEVGWIRRIHVLDTAYWGFLGVGTTFDIFQNIILISYLEYGVLSPRDTAY